jgi:ribonuclease HI
MTEIDDLSASLGRHYVLATDGGCEPNPGVGGWACVKQLRNGPTVLLETTLTGNHPSTTNNAMELAAATEGLRSIKERALPVLVLTDSGYVRSGILHYMPRWLENGWRNGTGKPVANRKLWEELVCAAGGLDVRWHWVRGHSGNPLNERADKAATAARRRTARDPSRPSQAFLDHGFTL